MSRTLTLMLTLALTILQIDALRERHLPLVIRNHHSINNGTLYAQVSTLPSVSTSQTLSLSTPTPAISATSTFPHLKVTSTPQPPSPSTSPLPTYAPSVDHIPLRGDSAKCPPTKSANPQVYPPSPTASSPQRTPVSKCVPVSPATGTVTPVNVCTAPRLCDPPAPQSTAMKVVKTTPGYPQRQELESLLSLLQATPMLLQTGKFV